MTVNVAVPPTGRSTAALMLPLPDAGHVAPPAAEHVQVAPVSAAGNVSATFEPGAAEGPAFEATIVYVTGVPGTSVAAPSVLVIDRSADGVNVSVSVAELSAPLGSLLPAGAAIVAMLTNDPVAVGEMGAVTVNVAVPATARSTLALMLPLPDAGQLEPAEAEHVQVAPTIDAGNVSATVAAVITDGPAFVATIVYVTLCPGIAEATPSVLVIDRSPVGVSVSVSVAELLPGVGSVTGAGAAMVAVLARLPVALLEIVAVSVKVAVPPGASVTLALMLPLPDAGQVEPTDAEHVHVAPDNTAGSVSVTVAAVAVDGPALEATIV